jgi:hypothetical protein
MGSGSFSITKKLGVSFEGILRPGFTFGFVGNNGSDFIFRAVGRNTLHHCAEQTTNRFKLFSVFPPLKKWTIEKTEGKSFGAMVERIAPYD